MPTFSDLLICVKRKNSVDEIRTTEETSSPKENESSAYRPNFNLNQINHNFNGVTSPVHDVIAGYSPVMDIRGGVLSLQEIHTAVQATLEELKHENLKIREFIGDVSNLRHIVDEVLKPTCKRIRHDKIQGLDSLKHVLRTHQLTVNAAQVPRSPLSEPCTPLKEPTNPEKRNSGSCLFPNIDQPVPTSVNKQRSSFPTGVRYPALNNVSLTQSPVGSRGNSRMGSPLRHLSPLLARLTTSSAVPGVSSRHSELKQYCDDVEKYTSSLQTIFINFTQRVFILLKTFCKQSRTRSPSNTTLNDNDDVTEMSIVEAMVKIRQMLWPSVDAVPSHLFSEEGFSKELAAEIDCERFPVVRILPDVTQKLDDVITRSQAWLNKDIMDTHHTKLALHRLKRRYKKTERLYQDMREQRRRLCTEALRKDASVNTNVLRLKKVEKEIESLKEEKERTRNKRRTLEVRMRTTTDKIDHLRARHRALRKTAIDIENKIETRERNRQLMESTVRSQGSDQENFQNKLTICDDYIESLKVKMQQISTNLNAWNTRYKEKANPEVLRNKLESAKVRVRLPAVRERTFILKSRMENLKEALTLAEQRLSESNVDWCTLCCHLNWPDQFILTLPDINAKLRRQQNLNLTDSDDSSSSASSTSAGKTHELTGATVRKVAEHVLARCPDDDKQMSYMLNLWLHHNGRQASIEKLLHALRASHIPEVAQYVEDTVRC